MYVEQTPFVVQQKLTQHWKSSKLQQSFFFNVSSFTFSGLHSIHPLQGPTEMLIPYSFNVINPSAFPVHFVCACEGYLGTHSGIASQ